MKTIIRFFEDSVKMFKNNPYLWEKKMDKFEAASYKEIREQVHQFASGLLNFGIKKGDRIALLSEGRNDWLVSELGILYTGAINVPLSILLNESELKFRLQHSGARMIIVSKNLHKKVKSVINDLPDLEKVILMDNMNDAGKEELLFSELKKSGAEYLKENRNEFEKVYTSIQENDYANISYTSGTTAEPKGIVLSHLNYYANIQQAYSILSIPPGWKIFLFLPWDHSFAHTAGIYSFMGKGASVAALKVGDTPTETVKNISINMKEVKPQIMLSVPSFAKNIMKNIENGIRDKGAFIEKLFKHALSLNYAYNKDGYRKGGGLLFLKLPMMKLYDVIIFKKIREQLGGQMEYFVGGGALLDIQLQKFFYAIGIPIYQGYGLSEASPIISINAPQTHKLGSSGVPVKNMEIKICDEDGKSLETGVKGEILVKGDNVMVKYWKNEITTRETIKDGWLHTGDLGYLDEDGFLYVMGRFKSLLISGDGEKYSPEGIEESISDQSDYILQCIVYNNQNPYTSILVVPDKEALNRFLKEKSLSVKTEEGKKTILKLIQSEIYEYRTGGKYEDLFPQRWIPSTMAVLDQEFTMENEFLNSLRKMVRGKIIEHYQETIDFLYTPEAKYMNNPVNFAALDKLELA